MKLSKKQILNQIVEKTILEENISTVESDSDKYYSVIEKYGITNKLNDIIDVFPNDVSEESSVYNKIDVNIGIICDEFLFYSLKDAANFEYISYSENLTVNTELDLLLVVSSWRGLDHTWDYVGNPNGEKRKSLLNLIEKYKKSEIPTVFYSKEDPISYKEYLSIAQVCDFIFTSAKEVIEDYKRDTGNNNVDFLEFGVNPMYHNPIGKNLSDQTLNKLVTFAGSWMVRFPERNKEALDIFNGIKKTEHKLCIIDRQYERAMKRYHFPSFLLGNVSATIPHERLMKLHKATTWGINLNSVKDSQTMFANRVYELQAMGNVIVSNYNKGVHSKFPHILIAGSSNDVENIFNNTSYKDKKNIIARGISEAMLNHTAYHRVSKLTEKVGLIKDSIKIPKILVVGESNDSISNYERQLYKNKEFISMTDFDKLHAYENYDFICYFSSDNLYEEHYLENLLSAFVYSEADIVTMNDDFYNYTNSDKYNKYLSMIKVSSYSKFNDDPQKLVYFNIPKTEITTHKTKKEMIKTSNKNIIEIIIPIENDYKYLEYKSLRSLTNVALHTKINIKILDLGKDTNEKDKILDRIKRNNENVKIIDGMSKSFKEASIKLLNQIDSKYVMFLNPQNEIILNTFSRFVDRYLDKDYDIVLGETYNPIDEETSKFDSETLNDFYKLDGLNGSIIFSTEYLRNLLQIDNTQNEELILLESLYNTESKQRTDLVIHNNFKNKQNVTRNNIIYLEDALKYEQTLKKILTKNNSLDEYVNKIFPIKFIDEYFELFKSSDDKYKAYNLLQNILNVYIFNYDRNNKKLNKILDLLF